MPRFLLARDLGIDLGSLTRSGMKRLVDHMDRFPSTRHMLMLLLVATVQIHAKDAAAADQALRGYLPGVFGRRRRSRGRVCDHPGCAPTRCSIAEYEARRKRNDA